MDGETIVKTVFFIAIMVGSYFAGYVTGRFDLVQNIENYGVTKVLEVYHKGEKK